MTQQDPTHISDTDDGGGETPPSTRADDPPGAEDGAPGTPDGPTDTGDDRDVPPIPVDAVFEILKNERRRIALRYLLERDEPVSLSDLSEHVAAAENDIERKRLDSTQRKRAYIGLYQCHLPKMDELNVVAYNSDRGIIELGPNVSQVEPFLDQPTTEPPWPRYYLGLAAVNATLFAGWLAAGTVIGGGASVSMTLAINAVTVLSFAGLALVHHRHWRPDGRATPA